MKINFGKVMMGVIIVLVALLLFALPDGAFGHSTDLGEAALPNPVLTYLDDHQVSYIAKMEKSTLVIYLVKGSVNQDELADLANMVDIRVELRDHLAIQ